MTENLLEENIKLFKEYENADENERIRIRDKICAENNGLVEKIAIDFRVKYSASDTDKKDFVSEGQLGLIQAIEKFDYRKGFKFSTFATFKIESKIKDYILKYSDTIHIPKEKLLLIDRIKKARADIEGDLGYEVNYDDVWELFKDEINKEEFDQAVQRIELKYIKSIDDFGLDQYGDNQDEDDQCNNDQDEDNIQSPDSNFVEQTNKIEIQEKINEILKNFDKTEKLIINMTFGLNGNKKYTNKEIAKKLKLSPPSISRKMKRINLILDDLGFRDNLE